MPRRDADAVYKAFRAACDSLFAKRDEARDAEANAHRAAIDDVKGEIADVLASVATTSSRVRSRSARRRASSTAASWRPSIEQMVRHVIDGAPRGDQGHRARSDRAARAAREADRARPRSCCRSRPRRRRRGRAGRHRRAAQAGDALERVRRSAVLGPRSDRGRSTSCARSGSKPGPILDDADRAQAGSLRRGDQARARSSGLMMMPSTFWVTAASTSAALLGGLFSPSVSISVMPPILAASSASDFCMCTKNGN